jgi:hypothetical protein
MRKVERSSGRNSTVPAGSKPHRLTLATTPPSGPPVTLLGSVPTASAAESFALNGNYAYVCDNNEVTVVNVANPASLSVAGTALSSLFQNAGLTYCAVQHGTLTVFSVQQNSQIGNNPGFSAFSLTNPLQPQLVAATPIVKHFFGQPVYIGNDAFVPTNETTYFDGGLDGQYGDLLAVDLTDFSAPNLVATLEQPQLTVSTSGETSGPNSVFSATQADTSLLYIGATTSTGNANNGAGILQTVDVANPTQMKIVSQLTIPNTVHFFAPLVQGAVAVGIGDTGGYLGQFGVAPQDKGNIVVAVFDVTDHRFPVLLSATVTNYSVGLGGGATLIGNNLFAFAGVVDVNGNPVLLVVDATNPKAPIFQSSYIAQPFTSMQAVGTTLFATLGSGGFAAYSIPGGPSSPALCPASIDAMLVIDQGANITPQGFLNAKAAMNTFIDSLHLSPDQIGVVEFASSALLLEKLSGSATQTVSITNSIATGAGSSYIGGGIIAAQAELTSTRHVPSATQVMIVLSDGADKAAPNNSATLTAANAAKAAGIRVISLQVGSGSGSLMQSIASSASDYYSVPSP